MNSVADENRLVVLDQGAGRMAALAARLALPLLSADQTLSTDLLISCEMGRLELRFADPKAPGPLRLDFAEPGLRRRIAAGRDQPLARAIGITQGRRKVLDATAGFGRDPFVLAALGCQVRALEREPILAALLAEALALAEETGELARNAGSMEAIEVDARDYLARIAEGSEEAPEVVYLDPMFPDRGKSAKAKKEMDYFRRLLGAGDQDPELLSLARRAATHRVVVKRTHRTAPLVDPKKTPILATVKSHLLRFDLYSPESTEPASGGSL